MFKLKFKLFQAQKSLRSPTRLDLRLFLSLKKLEFELEHVPMVFIFLADSDSDNKSEDSDMEEVGMAKNETVENMSSDDDADDGIPTVKVGDEEIDVTDVNEEIINKMTAEEKERYTQIFQDFYSHMYD